MTIQIQKVEPHWNYLLSIEDELERISRYVEFDERNSHCFSIEIARVLMACGAETDVVCKQLCKKLNPASEAGNINQYRAEIKAAVPAIPAFEVLLPRFGLTLHPWDNWERDEVPIWWTAHNKVKHHRDSEFHQGNLKNALNSVAGLFVMVLYLYREKATSGQLNPSPLLLKVTDEHSGGISYGGNGPAIFYQI